MNVSVAHIVFGLFAARVGLAIASRRLDHPKLGLYNPASSVTDHAAIDRDQAEIEKELTSTAVPDYAAARAIYVQGAYSKPYAFLNLSSGAPNVSKGAAVVGTSVGGKLIEGSTYAYVHGGSASVQVKYGYGDDPDAPTGCRVGGLVESGGEVQTDGCFADAGTVRIDGVEYEYAYDVRTGNGNGRSIQGFSAITEPRMEKWQEYPKYVEYYGDADYGDRWVTNALDGTKYTSASGRVFDFSNYGDAGRIEAVRKGTVFLNIYQAVLHKLEDAIADCASTCTALVDCNEEEVHAWDEAVAFYTGSQEKYLLYALADRRCQNFGTCGADGDEATGTAYVNYLLLDEFSEGRDRLLRGNCESPRKSLQRITELMAVPLVQGLLRYAYKVDRLNGMEKEKAEGAAFLAGIVPRIHHCDADAAAAISNNMDIGASNTDFLEVKAALESTYDCLGITCAEVGGLIKGVMPGDYYFEPCGQEADSPGMGLESGAPSLSRKMGIFLGPVVLYFLV